MKKDPYKIAWEWIKVIYGVPAVFVGFVVFIGVWLYAVSSWGFLIGVAIGWFPALIAAVIAGYLWPLVLIFGGILVHALGIQLPFFSG